MNIDWTIKAQILKIKRLLCFLCDLDKIHILSFFDNDQYCTPENCIGFVKKI